MYLKAPRNNKCFGGLLNLLNCFGFFRLFGLQLLYWELQVVAFGYTDEVFDIGVRTSFYLVQRWRQIMIFLQ